MSQIGKSYVLSLLKSDRYKLLNEQRYHIDKEFYNRKIQAINKLIDCIENNKTLDPSVRG